MLLLVVGVLVVNASRQLPGWIYRPHEGIVGRGLDIHVPDVELSVLLLNDSAVNHGVCSFFGFFHGGVCAMIWSNFHNLLLFLLFSLFSNALWQRGHNTPYCGYVKVQYFMFYGVAGSPDALKRVRPISVP